MNWKEERRRVLMNWNNLKEELKWGTKKNWKEPKMRNYVLVVLDTSDMVQDMSEMEEKYQIH